MESGDEYEKVFKDIIGYKNDFSGRFIELASMTGEMSIHE